MKTLLRSFFALVMVVGAAGSAVAQPQPPPPPPPPPPDGPRLVLTDAQRAKLPPIMEGARAKIDALHAMQLAQVRSKLSAAHLGAVQKIAQAARTAPPSDGSRPDPGAMRAAGQLMGAVLTPAERDAVVSVILATREKARTIARETLAQTKTVLGPEQQAQFADRMTHEAEAPPDPGRFLAMLTMPHPPRPAGPPPGR